MKMVRRAGTAKAKVALKGKLGVILYRMWVDVTKIAHKRNTTKPVNE